MVFTLKEKRGEAGFTYQLNSHYHSVCHRVVPKNIVGIRIPEKDNTPMNLPEIPDIKISNIGQFIQHSILVLW